MKEWTLALAAALALVSTSALAQGPNHPGNSVPKTFTEPLGPVGLDGYPPSPLCRASLGAARHIHCLHNIVWHGGMYYIDDSKEQR